MKYQQLGNTEIQVSTISMGCWTIGGGPTWGDIDDATSIAAIQAAFDAGINFFDTAEGYGDGRSESVLGEALKGRRHEAVIATKVSRGHLKKEDVRAACEASLKRLKTDYIDVYQIHWPHPAIPLAETLEALELLREQGKIRAIGVSNFGVRDLANMVELGRCETNQLPYNLIWRAIEFDITEKCREHNVGILCYSALAQGLLTGRFASADEVPEGRARTRYFSQHRPGVRHGEKGCEVELFDALENIRQVCQKLQEPMSNVAIAWLLAQPGVTSVIAGARMSEQILQNIQAVDLELSADILAELSGFTEDMKQRLGSNPDMWSSESRFR